MKPLFLLDKDTNLTVDLILKIIQIHETTEKPKLNKYYNYYKGNQAIMQKAVQDPTKPCNRIVTNYCYNIVNNYLGYITGIPVAYTSSNNIEEIQKILNYNDINSSDSELLKNALIFGKAFEMNYIDEDTQQRFKVLDSRECIPVYDNTINQNLLFFIRYYAANSLDEDAGYMVEVYTEDSIFRYQCNANYSNIHLIEVNPHFYNQVPVTVFSINSESESIFDKVITLQDAYNTLLSSEVDDFQAFCDAYLCLTGVDGTLDEDLQQMKENRTILLPQGAEANYLNKNISDTQIENLLSNIDDKIHLIANSPDFNKESFGTASGIAMKMKMLGMENTASAIVSNMTKALQKRIELICEILKLTDSNSTWRDINITFTRNLPVDELAKAQLINQYRGLVSDATLLANIPFVRDVQAELDKLAQQNTSLYNFEAGVIDGK